MAAKKNSAKKRVAKKAIAKKKKASSLPAVLKSDLVMVRMTDCNSKLAITDGLVPDCEPDVTLMHKVGVDGKSVSVFVRCTVSVAHSNSEESSVQIAVVYQCLYITSRKLKASDEEEVAYFVVSGTMAAWPYIRETVQSMFSKMGLPPLTLPLAKVNPSTGEITIG